MKVIVGIDIGGTKCAITFASLEEDGFSFLDKVKEQTMTEDADRAIARFVGIIRGKLADNPAWELISIGISCGGPLDAEKGLILAPPNLPLWDNVDIYTPLRETFNVPVAMENDANACALAEWVHGAGRGTRNMVFLTFGTGMGAGLILGGRLYSGSNDMAGEVGHIRLAADGPEGYGKKGSFEGFCSGGGIAKQGRMAAEQAFAQGKTVGFCTGPDDLDNITAERVAIALEEGDTCASSIFENVACKLGMGLSVLIDILNPEAIIIGSIFARQEQVLRGRMEQIIQQEALERNAQICRICPPALGEKIGDYAAVTVGLMKYRNQ